MANAITINQTKGSRGVGIMVIRKTGAGSDVIDFAVANTPGEIITEAYVAEVAWAGGALTLLRGANTVFQGGTDGHIDFTSSQLRLETGGDPQGTLTITLGAAGTALVKVHKTAGA